jgi:hypothetical protein
MKIYMLTGLALHAHALLDAGVKMTIDEVNEHAANHTLLDTVQDLANASDALWHNALTGLTTDADQKELSEALGRYVNGVDPGKVGIQNRQNGLLFIAAVCNEMVQANLEMITIH